MSRTKSSTIRNTPAGAASASVRASLGDRIFLKFGRTGTAVIHRITAAALLALVLFADYLIVLFTAVNVVPNIAVLVQQGTGVTLDARIDAVVAGWLLPVLFIVAAALVAEVFLLRRLWIAALGLTRRIKQSLFRLDGESAPQPLGTVRLKQHRTGKGAAAA